MQLFMFMVNGKLNTIVDEDNRPEAVEQYLHKYFNDVKVMSIIAPTFDQGWAVISKIFARSEGHRTRH